MAILLALAAVLMPQPARPDVLPPLEDEKWPTVAFSLEGVGSIEWALSERQSVSLWGGVGHVWGSLEGDQSWGVEIATEVRAYTGVKRHTGLNGAAYLGIGVLNSDREGTRVTVTPGAKFTLSTRTPSPSVLLEPYIGVSYPLVRDLDGDEWDFPDAPFLTLGFRIVLRHFIPRAEGAGQPGA